jgi:hypothetical protein
MCDSGNTAAKEALDISLRTHLKLMYPRVDWRSFTYKPRAVRVSDEGHSGIAGQQSADGDDDVSEASCEFHFKQSLGRLGAHFSDQEVYRKIAKIATSMVNEPLADCFWGEYGFLTDYIATVDVAESLGIAHTADFIYWHFSDQPRRERLCKAFKPMNAPRSSVAEIGHADMQHLGRKGITLQQAVVFDGAYAQRQGVCIRKYMAGEDSHRMRGPDSERAYAMLAADARHVQDRADMHSALPIPAWNAVTLDEADSLIIAHNASAFAINAISEVLGSDNPDEGEVTAILDQEGNERFLCSFAGYDDPYWVDHAGLFQDGECTCPMIWHEYQTHLGSCLPVPAIAPAASDRDLTETHAVSPEGVDDWVLAVDTPGDKTLGIVPTTEYGLVATHRHDHQVMDVLQQGKIRYSTNPKSGQRKIVGIRYGRMSRDTGRLMLFLNICAGTDSFVDEAYVDPADIQSWRQKLAYTDIERAVGCVTEDRQFRYRMVAKRQTLMDRDVVHKVRQAVYHRQGPRGHHDQVTQLGQ